VDGSLPARNTSDHAAELSAAVVRLSDACKGDRGVVLRVTCQTGPASGGIEQAELERRLLEIGFVEGARVELLHEGFIGRDPIAVKLDDMRVALRRREARGILLELESSGHPTHAMAKIRP
jgi:ferrous iron transport protein A